MAVQKHHVCDAGVAEDHPLGIIPARIDADIRSLIRAPAALRAVRHQEDGRCGAFLLLHIVPVLRTESVDFERFVVGSRTVGGCRAAIDDLVGVPAAEESGVEQIAVPVLRIVRPHAVRHPAVGEIRIEQQRRSALLEVRDAAARFRPRPRLVQRGQQHRGEDRDNRNDD